MGEAIVAVILVAVATGVGMTRDDFLEYVGAKIHHLIRPGKPVTQPPAPAEKRRFPLWRVAVWLFITALTGFLSWKAFLAPPAQLTSAFVNPLHDDVVRWKIARGIRAATTAGMLSTKCHVTVVRVQEQQAQDYAAAFEQILDVINWKYEPRFASVPIDRGLSVLAVTDQRESRACAATLINALEAYARNRSGKPLPVPLRWVMNDDAPDYLKKCPDDGLCIGVNFGSDDQR
jgi:hypothetical protein